MKKTNIVITGQGIISAIGNDKEAVLDSLRHQRTGIGTMQHLESEHKELPVGEGYSKLSADVDGSGAVDITDATLVQRWLAEMETPYNIGEQIETPTEKPTQPATTQPATTQPATDEEGWGRIIFRP